MCIASHFLIKHNVRHKYTLDQEIGQVEFITPSTGYKTAPSKHFFIALSYIFYVLLIYSDVFINEVFAFRYFDVFGNLVKILDY